jgi:proteasome lid subunit RPN8/RPN11
MTAAPTRFAPPAPSTDLDATAIDCSEWSERPLTAFLGLRENRFQVIFRQSVLDEMHLHGQTSTDIEVCGVLIGTGYRDSQGPYLLVDHCIRGNGARTKATNVTFTAETWAHIQGIMDRDHPGQKMVGWYHTHPNFGIFLSEMDLFICNNFFNLPWQMAFVYDPIGGDEGNFLWHQGKPERDPILIEDDVTPKASAIPLISVADAVSTQVHPETEEKILELLIRIRRVEKRQKLLVVAVAFLTAFFIMWELVFSPPAMIGPSVKSATQPAVVNQDHPGQDHLGRPQDAGHVVKSELH